VDDRRFAFGDNWWRFVDRIDEQRLAEAERSLKSLLDRDDLHGLTFLDIGGGNGIFSLAARRLGALVHSFDYDRDAVECALNLRQRFGRRRSVDDWAWLHSRCGFCRLARLGTFDIAYSYGVLHHTSAMYRAIEQAASRVNPGGLFAFALYPYQRFSRVQKKQKRVLPPTSNNM
jgi:2-polyprenyl-3-methyl-5-hydroxy-6-metoxy-1,4-benzoquinol methylase